MKTTGKEGGRIGSGSCCVAVGKYVGWVVGSKAVMWDAGAQSRPHAGLHGECA